MLEYSSKIAGMKRLSIIVINYNTISYLKKFLESLRCIKPENIDVDITVVDNGSRDGSVEMVEVDFPEVRLITGNANLGYARAANLGIKSSAGEHVIVSNTDITILGDSIEKLSEYLDNNREIGIVGPKVYDDLQKSSVQSSCRSFPSIQTSLFNRYSILTKLFPGNRWSKRYLMTDSDHNKPMEVDWVSGCFFIANRWALEEVGGFDEDFFMYNEDVDLCYRIKKAGWKVAYLPYAEIVHEIGVSRLNSKVVRERHKGMWLFYSKHYAKNRLMDIPIKIGILLRMIYSLLNY